MQHAKIKTLSFASVHFIVAFAVAYLITGSWLASSLTALIEPCVNTVAYYLHEQAWARRAQRRAEAVGMSPQSAFQPPSMLTTAV